MINIINTKSCPYITPPYKSPPPPPCISPPKRLILLTNEYKPRAYIRKFTVRRNKLDDAAFKTIKSNVNLSI